MKKHLGLLTLGAVLLIPSVALAHSPICDCMDNGDNTITCEGGFSDGSSAAGVRMVVLDGSGQELMAGKMSQDSEYTFDKPKGDYKVVFDAGDGHSIEIDGKNIVE
ncbi:hypothetical protein LJB99_01575 [Deltaproteobacteria bacterium OttesenSCG-928-K17]|nr:hypothetical protein [Deltaproteobacteria bacterium OttesenSCG-928-K17]